MTEPKRTPLVHEHESLGGRMVDFAGWWMPVQYRGVIEEHLAVRNHVGLFDVSHMGEIFVNGAHALETLQWQTSNDVSKLNEGEAHYSLLMNPKGAMVDDIIVYCLRKNERYLVCVNAANVEKDFSWMRDHNKGAQIENQSGRWAQIAIQGPKAENLAAKVLGEDVRAIKYFRFLAKNREGGEWIIARTGYTGEDGFEVFLPASQAVTFWRDLLKAGEEFGVQPIGLGARDTLRLEKKYSLYGHEITDDTNALEAGLGWVVKFDKGDFVGRAALEKIKAQGVSRKLVGFKMIDKGIARAEYSILDAGGKPSGVVTSGTMSPSLKVGIGIAYVPAAVSAVGQEIFVDIRGRPARAQISKTPFV